ncbi:hypothetical protein LguiA_003037 [Lonicera macranthoides]
MASSSKRPKLENHNNSSSPPPISPPIFPTTRNPNPNFTTTSQSTNTNPNPNSTTIVPSQEDIYLSNSTHLTRREVLNRRSHNHKELVKIYRDQYWFFMEELRVLYRDYVWKYGNSPFVQDNEERERANNAAREVIGGDGIVEGSDETNSNPNPNPNNLLCAFYGCKLKAMALTSFCQLHILSDSKQLLYKPCDYVIKSAQAGPITCGKPILRSTVPSLCNVHLQKAQQYVNRALKKAGLNASSSSKLAPKFHVVVAEYVREIQGKRKSALRANGNKVVAKHERAS